MRAIRQLLAEGAEMIAVNGGMSGTPTTSPRVHRAAGGKWYLWLAHVSRGQFSWRHRRGAVWAAGLRAYLKGQHFDLRAAAGGRREADQAVIVDFGHGGFAPCAGLPLSPVRFGKQLGVCGSWAAVWGISARGRQRARKGDGSGPRRASAETENSYRKRSNPHEEKIPGRERF